MKAETQIVIAAPESKVWKVLTTIKDWPKWQPDITTTSIASAAAVGVPFSWSAGGMTIHSTIKLFEPERSICWTGSVFDVQAIHVWTLRPLSDRRTQVKTQESMRGWLISTFYSSRDLQASDRRWLLRLKQAAESQQR